MTQKIGAGLLAYAETIWKTADTLRGAGIKESDWPAYMMPFFALMMLESRLRRFRQSRIDEFKKESGGVHAASRIFDYGCIGTNSRTSALRCRR